MLWTKKHCATGGKSHREGHESATAEDARQVMMVDASGRVSSAQSGVVGSGAMREVQPALVHAVVADVRAGAGT